MEPRERIAACQQLSNELLKLACGSRAPGMDMREFAESAPDSRLAEAGAFVATRAAEALYSRRPMDAAQAREVLGRTGGMMELMAARHWRPTGDLKI